MASGKPTSSKYCEAEYHLCAVLRGIENRSYRRHQVAVSCRYGIGQIYFRQEKYREAEYHFRAAADINKRSSVLHCYTGMALHRQGLHAEALQRLQVRHSRG